MNEVIVLGFLATAAIWFSFFPISTVWNASRKTDSPKCNGEECKEGESPVRPRGFMRKSAINAAHVCQAKREPNVRFYFGCDFGCCGEPEDQYCCLRLAAVAVAVVMVWYCPSLREDPYVQKLSLVFLLKLLLVSLAIGFIVNTTRLIQGRLQAVLRMIRPAASAPVDLVRRRTSVGQKYFPRGSSGSGS